MLNLASSRRGLESWFQIVLLSIVVTSWASAWALEPQSLTSSSAPQQSATSSPSEINKKITISTGRDWTDTGIALEPGNSLQISLDSGSAPSTSGSQQECNPASAGVASPVHLRIPSSAPDVLVAKLAANAQPFPVASSRNIGITEAGHLYLAPNAQDNCQHAIVVAIHTGPATGTVIKNKLSNAAQVWLNGQFGTNTGAPSTQSAVTGNGAGAVNATAPPNVATVSVDPSLGQQIEQLPRRVADQFNNLGDMVNFVIIGSQQQVEKTLAAANWHLADTSKSDAITKAIEMTRANQDYVQMPMSLLYLFGRVQDFGYEQAEPFAVVASRHHFRLWKAPFQFKGAPVWVGAGTHDIGFEKDQRNGSVTHKIDPNVDGERQNIAESLEKTGLVATTASYLPANPVQTARNATGGEYHSDGRILVITLK